MSEADLSTALKFIISTSGAIPLVLFALKYFTKDYLAVKEKALALEKAISQNTISNLAETQGEIKGTVKQLNADVTTMKDHMLVHRMSMTEVGEQLSKHSQQLEKTVRAFQMYVENNHKRMSEMETELIQLSKEATLVRQKKT